jgi:hypothetical protein
MRVDDLQFEVSVDVDPAVARPLFRQEKLDVDVGVAKVQSRAEMIDVARFLSRNEGPLINRPIGWLTRHVDEKVVGSAFLVSAVKQNDRSFRGFDGELRLIGAKDIGFPS